VSDSRSGSTLLENILSKSEDALSVGELHHLDSHYNKGQWGKTWGWKCSCGSSLKKCVFWNKVFANLKLSGVNGISTTTVDYQKFYWKYLPKLASNFDTKENAKSLGILDHVYNSIFDISEKKVIIDSSKNPLQGLAIYEKLHYDVKVIYLKRDLRSLVLSKIKWHKKFSGKKANIYKVLIACVFFRLRCLDCLNKIEDKDKIVITYEDLSSNPQNTIGLILDKFEQQKFEVPKFMSFGNDDHTIGGSPNRFDIREIKYDDAWKSKIVKRPLFNNIANLFNRI